MVKIIPLIIALIAFLYFFIRNCSAKSYLKKTFKDCNVIVYGKKGRGKDLIFQEVINLRKKEAYHSNTNYGHNFVRCTPNDLALGENSYDKFIEDKVQILDKTKYPYEKEDFYFSDAGVVFPSQYDNLLHKSYKTFPVAYALSRHLWSNNIHCNVQNLERIWKPLREQADAYIKCNRAIKIPFYIVVSFTTYEKYSSAQQELLPLKAHLLNGQSKLNKEQFEATNGLIRKHLVFIPKRKIKYDTREYHKIIFGTQASRKGAKCSPLSCDQK